MKKEPNLQEALDGLSGGRPIEMGILREIAERLFDKKTIRFSLTEIDDKSDNPIPSMKIIIDERLTLFFYKEDGAWEYDGWEMGDYNNYWMKGAL